MKYMHKFLLLLLLELLCGGFSSLFAQDVFTWDDFVQRYLADEEANEHQLNALYEELIDLHEHPQNINEVSQEFLARMPFLTAENIEEILAYRYRMGELMTLGELELIKGLSYDVRRSLPLFFYAGKVVQSTSEKKWKHAIKYGKQEIVTRTDIPLYQRAGYRNYSDSILNKYPNRKYLGNALYSSIRYQFNYKNQILWGVNAEKDAGEPFGKSRNEFGFDYYSLHLLLKDFGVINTLAFGDYRLNFGEGLVINNDFTLGISSLLSPSSTARGIKRNGSMNEHNFFRGAAVTLQLKRFEITTFTSLRNIDATLNKDSLTVSSIKDDGYHRTPLEMSKKGNLQDFAVGGNISYHRGAFRVGLTGVFNQYNRKLNPDSILYRRYYPRGKSFQTTGIHYSYKHHKVKLHGETARSGSGEMATANHIEFRVNSYYQLLLMQRFFSYKFYSTYANSISEGGRTQNESGLFIGMRANPIRHFTCLTYVDFFYHPWAKYQVSRSSYGQAYYVQIEYRKNQNKNLMFRYRYKRKQKDYTTEELAYTTRQAAKIQYDHFIHNHLQLRTAFDYSQVDFRGKESSKGYMVTQSIWGNVAKERIQIGLDCMLFFTDNYDSRLYAYERGLLYTFNFPAYYYHGVRTSLMMRYNMGTKWMMIAKYGMTHYFNRDVIGSSQQQIASSTKNDIYLQLRYKF